MWEILTKKDITELWLRSGGSSSRIAYAMSILLWRSLLERLASGVYIVRGGTKSIDISAMYWQIISKLIHIHSPSGGVIGGEKALEIHLQNYSIPDILIIYTRDIAMRIKLSDGREVHMRTLVSWSKTGKKNLWRTIVDNSVEVWPLEKIHICNKELALLEALSLRLHESGIEESSIVRFLRSFHPEISRSTLGLLTRLRYIRPINRLRVLARDLGYTDLYTMTLDIIRDEGGGCYVKF